MESPAHATRIRGPTMWRAYISTYILSRLFPRVARTAREEVNWGAAGSSPHFVPRRPPEIARKPPLVRFRTAYNILYAYSRAMLSNLCKRTAAKR